MKKKLILILSVFMLTYVISDSYSKEKSVFALAGHDYVLGGSVVGIKLYSKGIIVVDFEDSDNCPALRAGLRRGDTIISAGGTEVTDTDSFLYAVAASGGKLPITFERGGKIISSELIPKCDPSGRLLAGMWVRDSVGGVGTVTFYSPSEGKMVTLGHPVTDSDTGKSFTVQSGVITGCEILSVGKSTPGAPGEIFGRFADEENVLGQITENTERGLYASAAKIPDDPVYMKIAPASEVKSGGALLYSDIRGNGVEPYTVSIQKLYSSSGSDLLVKITDQRLLDFSGGIVQGMSGSPIVQSGKIAGALTHVFLDDPTSGYGIYSEKMAA